MSLSKKRCMKVKMTMTRRKKKMTAILVKRKSAEKLFQKKRRQKANNRFQTAKNRVCIVEIFTVYIYLQNDVLHVGNKHTL